MTVKNARLIRWFGYFEPDQPRAAFRFKWCRRAILRYTISIISVVLVMALRMALNPLLGDKHPFTLFFAAVAVTSWLAGFWPSLLAIVLSYLAADWFFNAPRHALDYGVDDLTGLCGFILAGLAIAFTSRALHAAKKHAEAKQEELAREIAARSRIQEELVRAQTELSDYAATLEKKVEERTTNLRESLQALENVLYHVAHDLRAPLRAMQGFITLLLEEYAPHFDPEGRDYAQRVAGATSRMDVLIRDLLDYGRLGHVNLPIHRVDIEKVLDTAWEQMACETTAKRATMLVRRPLPSVMANENVLRQILFNLLSNALIYVVPGISPRIEVWAETEDNNIRLSVKDNGIGIRPEYHQKIFELFERLRGAEDSSGTGIGLAIVSKGAQRMKGRVGVESESGKGSRFWVELPAASTDQ